MKKLYALALLIGSAFATQAQTTVYTTGQSYTDAWTGWSTPVTSGITASSVNGAYIWTFSGMNGQAFSVETYRQFTINSNDLDFYLSATTQNCTVSIEYSTDNVTYTQIGSQAWGAGFALSTLIVPTFDPVVSTFYIKLKMVGTFGSPSQTNFNNLKIDAELTAGNSVSIAPTTTQNIAPGVNGTVLSASELPSSASSREWKYSTVSGAGYVSFGTAQTGATYTPNFASAGTYYVVCVSNFSGDMQTSNEVQINVVAGAGVEDFKLGSTVIYNSSQLSVITPLVDYNVQVMDLSGKVIVSETNLKSLSMDQFENGIYFVSFYYAGSRKTIKVAHVH